MGLNSGIAWCDHTWNPWQGCHHVSSGCEHCYMFAEKRRYGQDPDLVIRSKPLTFCFPMRVKKASKIFTCSWSDWFLKEADPWREEAWEIIRECPHLTFMILTKRIERAAGRLPWGDGAPWPNVWLGVSVENQETADRRIPLLLAQRAAVKWVSCEPMLGPIDFSAYLPDLGWMVCGGESGALARVCELAWLRSVVAQCRSAAVPCFVKQLGSHAVCAEWSNAEVYPLADIKGADPSEWPNDLQVQAWPVVRAADGILY